MEILFIFHMGELRGGANLSGLTLIRGLRQLGHRVSVLVPRNGELTELLENEGFEYKVCEFKMTWPCTRLAPGDIIKFLPRVWKNRRINKKAMEELWPWVSELQPDIIHSNTSVFSIGAEIAQRLNVPHVTHFREFGFKDTGFVNWGWNKRLRNPLQYNIAITEAIKISHCLPKEKSCVVYNGLIEGNSDEKIIPDREYILYVGSLYEAKGILDLIEAYAHVPARLRTAYPLKIVGTSDDTKFKRKLHERVREHGLDGNVEFLNQRNDIPELLSRAKALVVPSHAEAFGRVVVEAMDSYCPVIGRDTAGIKEQFDNGYAILKEEIGFRFMNQRDLELLLVKVMETPIQELMPMLKSAHAAVERLYTKNSYVDSVMEFYKSILRDRGIRS